MKTPLALSRSDPVGKPRRNAEEREGSWPSRAGRVWRAAPSGATPGRAGARGFTLIEMIGVMTLMAISVAVLTPSLAQRVSRMKGAAEDAEIAAIGEALVQYVTRYQQLPGARTWSGRVAALMNRSEKEVLYSIPEDVRTARVYLVHPSFTASVLMSSRDADPIWAQSAKGAAEFGEARILLLSVHRAGLTLPVSSGVATSEKAFINIWDWHLDPATRAPPVGWSSEWERNGDYLHVERINLDPRFRRVTFSNTETSESSPYLRVGNADLIQMGSRATFATRYLDGTFLRLYQDNPTADIPGPLQISHAVRDHVNFVYANSQWELR